MTLGEGWSVSNPRGTRKARGERMSRGEYGRN